MTKTIYEAPCTKILEVRIQGRLLQNSVNSVEGMRGVAGVWDEDDE